MSKESNRGNLQVQKLQDEQMKRAQQVEDLSRKSIDDLWRTDLDAFLALWDVSMANEIMDIQNAWSDFSPSGNGDGT